MIDMDVAGAAAQLGAAGLIGALWLAERRAAGERERQLREAHDRLTAERGERNLLMELVREHTRATAALEAAQRRTEAVLERLLETLAPRRAARPAAPTPPTPPAPPAAGAAGGRSRGAA